MLIFSNDSKTETLSLYDFFNKDMHIPIGSITLFKPHSNVKIYIKIR